MVDFEYKRFGLKFRQIMFSEKGDADFAKEDVCIFHGGDNNNYTDNEKLRRNVGVRLDHQLTLLTDLSISEEALFSSFKKNCKYEIRRADREGISAEFFCGEDAAKKTALLDSFEQTYNVMFSSKNMPNRLNRNYVENALKKNYMTISCASYRGNPIVYHAYVIDSNNALLLYSASILWTDSAIDSKLVGWANKRLHWEDMLFFKHAGISRYEWGGISSVDTPNGIDRFKMEFSGTVVQYDNCLIANSILGAAYVGALKIRDRVRK